MLRASTAQAPGSRARFLEHAQPKPSRQPRAQDGVAGLCASACLRNRQGTSLRRRVSAPRCPREGGGRTPAGVMASVVAKREGPPFVSEAAVRGNAAVLDYCRTSVSALSGATAGILGLTGLYGFIFYLLASVLLSLLLILKAGRRWNKYFKSRRPLFTGGLIGGLFTYVLFWTFLYGMVHVY
nr:ER membrane protein complex subunit 6 [Loxodonta africana]